tara:strand:- start:162 stop:1010 length:849 start_codon:yes stop_codon:yes gene_type:complete
MPGKSNDEIQRDLFDKGLNRLKEHKYELAINFFSRLIKLNPKNAYALFYRGKSKILLKDYQSALDDFSEVIKIDSSNVDLDIGTNENLQDLLDGKKFGSNGITIPLRESINDFKKNIELISLNAKNEKEFLKRGKAKFFLMDYKGAFDDYSKGISLNPSNADSYLSRANAGIKLKKYDQYKKDLLTSQKIFRNKVNKENNDNKIILRKRQEEYFKLLREKGFNKTPRWTLNDKTRFSIIERISIFLVCSCILILLAPSGFIVVKGFFYVLFILFTLSLLLFA